MNMDPKQNSYFMILMNANKMANYKRTIEIIKKLKKSFKIIQNSLKE